MNNLPTQCERTTFKSLDYSRRIFAHTTFSECTFEGCNFAESIWCNGRFSSCTFKSCNIILVNLEGSRLQDVRFDECKIVGAGFYKCDKMLFSISIKNSVLSNCNFSDLNMKHTSFHKSRVRECYFTNTLLTGADFSYADLQGSLFHNCDLSKADFRHAVAYAVDPRSNNIKKAQFSLPEALSLLNCFDVTINS